MIITNNEAALRVQCSDVLSEDIPQLISLLESELNNANRLGKNGIGLAAPQIGIAKNIAILRFGKTSDLDINLVNCKIIKQFDPFIFKDEGCLSFPGRVENTKRFQEVFIESSLQDSFIATGMLAVACQHELDHLNSTLFMDRKVESSLIKLPKRKIGPNDLCICGKNKKFKKCCMK